MKESLDKIGNLFRDTLKDHHMDGGADLWSRVNSQLSAQPGPAVPKPSSSIIHHLSWVKVAAAASVMIGVALAYNYIYLPLQQPEIKINTSKTLENKQPEIVTDSNITQNNQINTIDNAEKTALSNTHPLINNKDNTPKTATAEATEKAINNNSNTTVYSPTKNSQNPTQPAVQPQPQSQPQPQPQPQPQQPQSNVIDRIPVDTHQNTIVVQDNSQKDDVILTADIPNIFTPNGDGVNDYFIIRNIEKCSSSHLVIKDRSGRVIFEKLNYQNDWNAGNVPDGVYFYFFKYNAAGNNFGKQGSISIKR
jgi:gliding motility-associated-like protein